MILKVLQDKGSLCISANNTIDGLSLPLNFNSEMLFQCEKNSIVNFGNSIVNDFKFI